LRGLDDRVVILELPGPAPTPMVDTGVAERGHIGGADCMFCPQAGDLGLARGLQGECVEAKMRHYVKIATLAAVMLGGCAWEPWVEPDVPVEDIVEPDVPVEDIVDCSGVQFFGHQPQWSETGTVFGRVTAPSGMIPVAGSRVMVEVGGEVAWAVSLDRGCFRLDLPPGSHSLVVEKGRYRGTATAQVRAGERANIGPIRLGDGGVRIAVLYGQYDDVGELISHLGLPTDGYLHPHDLLSDPAKLRSYHVVFANCGSSATTGGPPYSASDLANLKAWVEDGGTLYASDWEYETFQAVAPNGGTFAEDPHIGPKEILTATLLDRDLIALLNKDTVQIRFDLPAWTVPEDSGSSGQPLVRGRVAGRDRPLALLARPGAGRAVFTSFHNEEQLTDDILAVLYQMILML
jgi:hypothetical protein